VGISLLFLVKKLNKKSRWRGVNKRFNLLTLF
jgi:hypothetical protein